LGIWLFWFLSVGLCVGKNQIYHLLVGSLFTMTTNYKTPPPILQLFDKNNKFSNPIPINLLTKIVHTELNDVIKKPKESKN